MHTENATPLMTSYLQVDLATESSFHCSDAGHHIRRGGDRRRSERAISRRRTAPCRAGHVVTRRSLIGHKQRGGLTDCQQLDLCTQHSARLSLQHGNRSTRGLEGVIAPTCSEYSYPDKSNAGVDPGGSQGSETPRGNQVIKHIGSEK